MLGNSCWSGCHRVNGKFWVLLEASESCRDPLLRQQTRADEVLPADAYISAYDYLSIRKEHYSVLRTSQLGSFPLKSFHPICGRPLMMTT